MDRNFPWVSCCWGPLVPLNGTGINSVDIVVGARFCVPVPASPGKPRKADGRKPNRSGVLETGNQGVFV